VKVRIKATPRQLEVDGVRLDRLQPGTVRQVSSSIGSWLIAENYAEPEMRCDNGNRSEETGFSGVDIRASASDGPRRRRDD
jgi:hypothetical protein